MPKTIISDTSCFIVLGKIDALYILNEMYGIILITNVVAEGYGKTLPDWVKIQNPTDLSLKKILEPQIELINSADCTPFPDSWPDAPEIGAVAA